MRSGGLFVLILSMLIAEYAVCQDMQKKSDPSFFPIAVWAQDPQYASSYSALGINLYINIHGGLNQEKMDQLRRANVRVIAHQNAYGLTQLKDPLIFGWINGDEPDNAQRNRTARKWEPCIDPADVIRDYRRIRRNDPTRPVYLNVGRGVAYTEWIGRGVCRGRTDMYMVSNNGYLKGCDIASFYMYPVNAPEEDVQGKLWYIAKGIDSLRRWSNDARPAWCWIETTRISEKSKRKPTPAEVKAEVWMALIHGAKGFGYFCHSFVQKDPALALLNDPEMMLAIRGINQEVRALAPLLNSPDTRGYARVRSSNARVPVDILTKRDKKTHYIFSVGMREEETRATFYVKSGKTVEVIGEGRTIEIKKGQFADHFAPYAVHLYKITK